MIVEKGKNGLSKEMSDKAGKDIEKARVKLEQAANLIQEAAFDVALELNPQAIARLITIAAQVEDFDFG